MADYSVQIDDAYRLIKEAGGAIVFDQAPTDTVPADADAPWEGNTEPGAPFPHFAILLPLAADERTTNEGNHKVIIPAKGLPFEVRKDIEFTDGSNRTYSITAVTVLAPDPTQIILYTCECALWPAAT